MTVKQGVKIILLTVAWFAATSLMDHLLGKTVVVHDIGYVALGMLIYGLVDD